MTTLYLVRGNEIIGSIDTTNTDVVALPLLGGAEVLTLLNEQHLSNIQTALGTPTQYETIEAIGLSVSEVPIGEVGGVEIEPVGEILIGAQSVGKARMAKITKKRK